MSERVIILGPIFHHIKRNRLILDVLFKSRAVEKSGTGFRSVNDFCKQYDVTWNYRKEAYGFFFELGRTIIKDR